MADGCGRVDESGGERGRFTLARIKPAYEYGPDAVTHANFEIGELRSRASKRQRNSIQRVMLPHTIPRYVTSTWAITQTPQHGLKKFFAGNRITEKENTS